MANREKWAGPNVTFELVALDGKGSPQESLLQLKNATDQGIRYVVQNLSSAVGLALVEAVNRHNERNPGKEVIYMTAANQASEMTNEKCSFWSFRFDSNVDMRTEGLTTYLAKDKSIKKVYLINQNYSMGQEVSASLKTALKAKRPDIQIVGDDLHPLLQVKDFAPYVAKIRASGADTLISSSWSGDLSLLVKAMKDGGLKLPFYTYNGSSAGIPTALAAASADNVKLVSFGTSNDDAKLGKNIIEPFKAKFNDDFYHLPNYTLFRMTAQAMKESKSTETLQVARALENMRINDLVGEVQMRKADHQIQRPMIIGEWKKVNGKDVMYDSEKTGWGFKSIDKVESYVSSLPTTCQMKRPS
jgi:branched-chain amino acid transport system substrate-binding protein